MIEFKFSCPHCGTHILCEVGYTGWQINCPACKQALVVPAPGMAAPAAPAGGVPQMGQRSAAAPPAAGIPPSPAAGRPKKSRGALIGMIVGGVLLAAIVAVIAVMKFGKGESTGEQTPPLAEGTNQPVQDAQDNTGGTTATKPSNAPAPGTVWMDTFETGLDNWKPVPDASPLTKGVARTISGTVSAKVSNTQEKTFRNIGEVNGHARFSFWLYDLSQSRVFGELRSYSGNSYNKGSLRQALSIGRYDTGFEPGKGTLADERVDKTKYQGRVLYGANTGWFNLDGPAAPSRSTGWHKFEIERSADGKTINFFVDGNLGKTVTGAIPVPLNLITIGSLGPNVTSTSGDAWFDDVKLEYLSADLVADAGAGSHAGTPPPAKKTTKPAKRKEAP